MKNFLRIMGVVALGMMVFNVTIIDWNAPLKATVPLLLLGFWRLVQRFYCSGFYCCHLKFAPNKKQGILVYRIGIQFF